MAIVPISVSPSPFRYQEDHFIGAGVDSFSSPTEQTILGGWTQLDNLMPVSSGALDRRRGYSLWGNYGSAVRFMAEYQQDSTGARRILLSNATNAVQAFNEDGTVFYSTIFTPTGGAGTVRAVNSRDTAYFADGIVGDLKKWTGSAVVADKWGIVAAATPISVGAPIGAGAITLLTGRNYFVVFHNSTTGDTSGLNPVSASTGPLTANNIALSSIAVSADPQVDTKKILATGDGGDTGVLYELTSLANATTTYTDTTPEGTLLLANVWLETDQFGNETGVSENTPPPNGILPTKHAGRLWLADGQFLYFSKSLSEVTTSTGTIVTRYETAWPGDNQMDSSIGAETIRGLVSDGQSLYVGTERHIRRIEGDNPSNFTNPEIVYNETGVLNQDVWKIVFSEGSPKGAIWLTPDRRVVFSDYNTYADIGEPIQNQLNTINLAAATKSWSIYVSDGQYDLYILNVPINSATEPNRTFVFDLRHKKWVTWTLTDNMTAGLFNINASGVPQWLMAASGGSLYRMDSTSTQDRVGNTPLSFTSTVQTQWLSLGDPTVRKILNEMDIQTSDSGMAVSVNGASTRVEFNTPLAVATNAALVTGPLGGFKVFLAGKISKSRYYQFQFSSTGTSTPVLDSWSVEGVGISRV